MKLIVTDLDNTLLRRDKSISSYTAEVFQKLRKKGHLVAFATARGRAVERFVDMIHPDVLICNGGASVSVRGNMIHQDLLSEEDVHTILTMCREFTKGTALITVENQQGYYCNFVPSDSDRRAVFTYCDFADFKAPAYKVSPELERDEWAEAIVKACSNCSLLNFTGEKWRRYATGDSDKASALKILVEHLGIPMQDVIALGDDQNDLGMLQLAGTAVAVGNAIEPVKDAADYITESCDRDGAAKFLEKALLL